MKTKEELINELMNERVSKATVKIKTFKCIEGIYKQMCEAGYVEQMKVFKNVVWLTVMIHPDWDETQMLEYLMKKFMLNN